MQKTVVKYSIIFFLLLIYINRGFFITPYEFENHENKEVNSLVEWIMQLVTGESNDIDEDGDLSTDCNSIKIAGNTFCQEFTLSIELLSLYSDYLKKKAFSTEEKFYLKDIYTQIDHPPQLS